MRYRAKPLEVEAMLWPGDFAYIPHEWVESDRLRLEPGGTLLIETLEGPARAKAGEHYLVRGTVGEFYPVRRDIFEAKYEAVQ